MLSAHMFVRNPRRVPNNCLCPLSQAEMGGQAARTQYPWHMVVLGNLVGDLNTIYAPFCRRRWGAELRRRARRWTRWTQLSGWPWRATGRAPTCASASQVTSHPASRGCASFLCDARSWYPAEPTAQTDSHIQAEVALHLVA